MLYLAFMRKGLARCALLLAAGSAAFAEDLAMRTVDGLGRPLSDVEVNYWWESSTFRSLPQHVRSDQTGTVHLLMPNGSLCDPMKQCRDHLSFSKQGYLALNHGVEVLLILLREFNAKDVQNLLRLDGDAFRLGLRELLAGHEAGEFNRLSPLEKTAFRHDAKFLPALTALVADGFVTVPARNLLALLDAPEALRLIMRIPPPLEDASDWRSWVASALVRPDDESEWSFLRDNAMSPTVHDLDAAIQSLKLNGSPRAGTILEEARQKNLRQEALIKEALDYVESRPAPLEDRNLAALSKRVARAMRRDDYGQSAPHFDEAGDNALIDFTFRWGENRDFYTAAFHRADGVWVLRGVRWTSSLITFH